MAIEYGVYRPTICGNGLALINDKLVVRLSFDFGGEYMDALIYVTDGAKHIARAQLLKCGFNPETQQLEELHDNPMLLAGRQVEVHVQDYNGKPQIKIQFDSPPSKDAIANAQAMLRGGVVAAQAPGADDDLPF